MLLLATIATAGTFDSLWTYEGPNDSHVGNSLGAVGDVDDDGTPDLLVGAYADTRSGSYAGSVSLFLGTGSGFDTSPVWEVSGGMAWAYRGNVAAPLGDVNADGRPDFGASASADSTGGMYAGSVSVWYGGEAASSGTPAWEYVHDVAGDAFGAGLATAGDVDGDGDSEVLVGASQMMMTGIGRGFAWIFEGDPAGLAADPSWEITGASSSALLGTGVAGGGDLDGDGYGDFAVGAPYESGAAAYDGAVYVFRGGATGPATEPDTTVYGDGDMAYAGWALAFGDFDADGHDDLAVGMPESSYTMELGGAVAVYPGTSAGLDPTASWIEGGSDNMSWHGASLSVGDVDDDGTDDLLVGAPYLDGGGTKKGAAFLYLGSATGLAATEEWWETGSVANEMYGGGVAIVGDTNADGWTDFAVGANGAWGGGGTDGRVTLYSGGDDDFDRDGYGSREDCDDDDPAINPGAAEVCDGVDQDCDDIVDDEASDATEWHADVDRDGYGAVEGTLACEAPAGAIADGSDCDDTRGDVNPAAAEAVADGLDADCDGAELCYVDGDADGYPAASGTVSSTEDLACDAAGEADAAEPVDCDDTDPEVFPGAPEPDDTKDYDCVPDEDTGGGDTDDVLGEVDTGKGTAPSGCGCATGGAPASVALLTGLAVLGLRRRRA